MLNNKKIVSIACLMTLLVASTVVAAPTSTVMRTILPETTATYDLGSVSKIWDDIYTGNITISGTCTGCGSSATTTINGVSGPTFTFNASSTGTDFTIATSSGNVYLNIPSATSTARGLLTSSDWTAFNNKLSTSTNLTSANFATTSVSQWVNDAGYVTSTGGGVTSANGITGEVNWIASGPGLSVASSGQNITYTYTSSSLGLGTASVQNLAAFLQPSNNLSELTATSTARTNIGLGSVENTALSTWAGSANLTTVGTIGSGTWNGGVIGIAYGGFGAAFTDPNADQLMFWDDSAGKITGIGTLTGAAISNTTLTINDVTCTDCLGVTEIADSYLLNDGDAGTGVFDFGGATSFELPNGAGGTTVDATGETTIDSTSRSLNFYDGTAEVKLNPEQCFSPSWTIENPTATEDDVVLVVNNTSTITRVWAVNKSVGDTVTFNIVASSSRAAATSTSNKLFTSYTAITATTTPACYMAATTTGCTTGVFGTGASTTINFGQVLRFSTTAASSSQFSFGLCWRENP